MPHIGVAAAAILAAVEECLVDEGQDDVRIMFSNYTVIFSRCKDRKLRFHQTEPKGADQSVIENARCILRNRNYEL